MGGSQSNSESVEEQAAYWVRVLKNGGTVEQQAAFRRWLNASPGNMAEFEREREMDRQLQRFYRVRPIDVEALIERSKQERRTNRRRAWAACTAVAGLGLSVGGVILYERSSETYTTSTGQQLIALEEGSVAALNIESQMRVEFTAQARDIYLDKGQGLFRVRHDERPFRVHAGDLVVEARGTQFDVLRTDDRTRVAVVEGGVKVEAGSLAMDAAGSKAALVFDRIAAGESVIVRHDGQTDGVKDIDVAAAIAWRQPEEQLDFRNLALAEIAEEFNRYNAAPKLRIEGEELRKLRFHRLTFHDPNPKPLLKSLARDKTLEIVPEGDDIVIRERSR